MAHRHRPRGNFEAIGNGPDGLRKRIEIEVPRDLVIKAGIERV